MKIENLITGALETLVIEKKYRLVLVCKKIRTGHQANFSEKGHCFLNVLFPFRAILRSILKVGETFPNSAHLLDKSLKTSYILLSLK